MLYARCYPQADEGSLPNYVLLELMTSSDNLMRGMATGGRPSTPRMHLAGYGTLMHPATDAVPPSGDMAQHA